MRKRHNLVFVLLLITLAMLFLSACSFTRSNSPGKVAREQVNTILECIETNDTETIKSLFAPDLQESPELDEQIQSLLDFMDGEIISYAEPFGERGSGMVRDGETVYQELIGQIADIQTDSGKTYRLNHSAIFKNKNNPDCLGVYYIEIQDVDLVGQNDVVSEFIAGDPSYPDSHGKP